MILLRIFSILGYLNITFQFNFIEKAEYIGCFKDFSEAPDLRQPIFFSRYNNSNICFDQCLDKGYTYAATQFGHKIFSLANSNKLLNFF